MVVACGSFICDALFLQLRGALIIIITHTSWYGTRFKFRIMVRSILLWWSWRLFNTGILFFENERFHKKSVFCFCAFEAHIGCPYYPLNTAVSVVNTGVPYCVSKHNRARTVLSWRARIRTLGWRIDSPQYGSSGCVRVRLRFPEISPLIYFDLFFAFLKSDFFRCVFWKRW